MKFISTDLPGVYVVHMERIEDERGSFARTFCREEFAAYDLDAMVAQCNVSHNHRAGTLRGLHFQLPPAAEAKLVRCTRGALFDVAVDLRPGSPYFGRWVGVELRAAGDALLYIPKGFGHGFQTLVDDTEVSYQMSAFYAPDRAAGVRYDDATIGVQWPLPVTAISPRDRQQPTLAEAPVASLALFWPGAAPL
jgi:dTDP-4-dehydrorhamnose 3,5-epimerase